TSNARIAGRSRADAVRTNMALLDAEPRLDQVVDGLRVGLAARRLHHLADEPARQRRLLAGLRGLVRIGGDDLVHRFLDSAGVGHLLQPARLDERARIAALVPDDLEQILGDLAGDRAFLDQVDDRAELI